MTDTRGQAISRRRRKYLYQPLDDPTSQIRLIKLLPCADEDLKCEIATFSFTNLPTYCAVSYECGSPDTEVEVFVDGQVANIRYNLFLFLKKYHELRESKHNSETFDINSHNQKYPELIWADALSIDQSSADEKRIQISLLGSIFYRARHVYAWLGWSTLLDSKALLHMIKALGERGSDLDVPNSESDSWRKYNNRGEPWQNLRKNFARKQYDEFKSQLLMPYDDFEIALMRFVRLSFWTRRWPLQECLLGKDVTLLLDDNELQWSKLMLFWSHVASGALTPLLEDKVIDTTLHAMWTWHSRTINKSLILPPQFVGFSLDSRLETVSTPRRKRSGPRPLLEMSNLLKQFKNTICELPCDHLYSLLNLTSGPPLIEADYKYSPSTLFCRMFSDSQNYPDTTRRTKNGYIGGFGDLAWAQAVVRFAQALGLMDSEGPCASRNTAEEERVHINLKLHQTAVPSYKRTLLSVKDRIAQRFGGRLSQELEPRKVAESFRSPLTKKSAGLEDEAVIVHQGRQQKDLRETLQEELGNNYYAVKYDLENVDYWSNFLPIQDVRHLQEVLDHSEILERVDLLSTFDISSLESILAELKSLANDESALFWYEKMFAGRAINQNPPTPIYSDIHNSMLKINGTQTSSHDRSSLQSQLPSKRLSGLRRSTQKTTSSTACSLIDLGVQNTLPAAEDQNPDVGPATGLFNSLFAVDNPPLERILPTMFQSSLHLEARPIEEPRTDIADISQHEEFLTMTNHFYHLGPGVGIFTHRGRDGKTKIMQWYATQGLKNSNRFWSQRICNVELDFSLDDFLSLMWKMIQLDLT